MAGTSSTLTRIKKFFSEMRYYHGFIRFGVLVKALQQEPQGSLFGSLCQPQGILKFCCATSLMLYFPI